MDNLPDKIYVYENPYMTRLWSETFSNASSEYIRKSISDELVECLKDMIDREISLAESGDAGFYDAEKLPHIIEYKNTLSRYQALTEKGE